MDRIEIADKMKMWIRNIEWWLGEKIVRFGWWLITDRHKNSDIYSGHAMEQNGKKYSLEYVKGENE